MKKISTLVVLGILLALSAQAMAGDAKPIQLSLTPDMAIFDKHTTIRGLTLSIWGENPQEALALGIINGSTGDSAGFSVGIVNYAEKYRGLMLSAVNYTKSQFSGWQAGLVNYTKGPTKGLQTGVVNYAGNLRGLQLGAVNYADKTSGGLQIGVINIIPDNHWFSRFPHEVAPAMIIVNWRF